MANLMAHILAEIQNFELGNTLVSLSEDEYDEIKDYYIELKSAYLKEEK